MPWEKEKWQSVQYIHQKSRVDKDCAYDDRSRQNDRPACSLRIQNHAKARLESPNRTPEPASCQCHLLHGSDRVSDIRVPQPHLTCTAWHLLQHRGQASTNRCVPLPIKAYDIKQERWTTVAGRSHLAVSCSHTAHQHPSSCAKHTRPGTTPSCPGTIESEDASR